LPAIAWFLLTFYLLTLPGKKIPDFELFSALYIDKVAHVGMFAVLVSLFVLPFAKFQHYNLAGTALFVGVASLLYGVAMEFVQLYFIEGRSFEIADIAADGAGSFLPFLVFLFRKKAVVKHHSSSKIEPF
jgi:VanZ family protein